MAFNRSRGGSGGGRDFNRPRFSDRGSDRGSRGPVEMHKAVCDKCHQDCEVPFRPTSGKPIFCSNCFESNRGSDVAPRRFEERGSSRPSNFEDRPMFDATCDDCGNSCKVPFQPRGDKPIYCSNCFGEKKGASDNGNKGNTQCKCDEQVAALNSKLDRILKILDPEVITEVIKEEVVIVEEPLVEAVVTEIESKPSKKKSSKKS